ncbi:pyridoxal phosphate-dependent transferase [Clohesyomyces aquaticus]|uniref:Pyridoxal phosphate-dependent transferase n=1 Tax=Clohesyomyces aquaticus TaxID=1231657 RepID=A0A1Y1ZJ15_9PLEO|nr:pyridoxal phosphate-dependent transferase [Clohesyomyces aquaticus]
MISQSDEKILPELLTAVSSSILTLLQSARTRDILPAPEKLASAASTLTSTLPKEGQGLASTTHHLLSDIVPAVSSSSLSSRYFGFVTGGVTPAARLADYIVSTLDECLAVRIPNDTIASNVEHCAISMLSELLYLDQKNKDGSDVWTGSFTPGSSTSNLYGIASGREHVLQLRGARAPSAVGLLHSFQAAGIREVQLLCSMAHPSIIKAASLLGLGRAAVKQLGIMGKPWCLDLEAVERELSKKDVANIVSVGMGEVNSGKLGITQSELTKLRELCDRYKAWLHVDAAYGIFIRALPNLPEYQHLKSCMKYVHSVADSITGDAHKLLNVPFDSGFFFTRHPGLLKDIFAVPKTDFSRFAIPPVYFSRSTPVPGSGPANPTDVNIQNARRFRALPAYATLAAYGREGYTDMLVRQVSLARGIASWLHDHSAYELLPTMPDLRSKESLLETVFILIIFRATDEDLNESLLKRINETGKLYAQGIIWEEKRAIRCAIANWSVHVEEDLAIVTGALEGVAARHDSGHLYY